MFGRRASDLGRSGSAVGKGDDTSPGQENRRPSVYGASSDPRTLRKSNSMQRGSGTSGTASGSPRSVLENQPGPKRGYERSGSGAAYQEARALYRSSSLARTSRDPQDPPQPGSARASQVEPSTFAEGGRTLRRASSVVGKTGKRVGTKSSQNPGGVPLQAVWENVAMWCGQWCGQAPKDALTDDIDELHSKLDRLQAHCEKLEEEAQRTKEQNDRLRENVRLLQSNSMGRGSGGPRSSVVMPSPVDSNDDLLIPKGRGPVRKGDLIGNTMAWFIGGPKPR